MPFPSRTVPVFRQDIILAPPPPRVSVIAASVKVGSSLDNEITVTATGISNPGQRPIDYVFLQARQYVNTDYNYRDEFALQVIQLGLDFVTFRIKRLDVSPGETPGGWDQELQVDILLGLHP
jgi:hypothetical protein